MSTLTIRRNRLQSIVAAQAAAIQGATSLAIATVEAYNVKQPSNGAAWSMLRLVTKEGVEGWGEGKPLTREAMESLKPQLAGASAGSYEALRAKLKNHPACGAVNMAALDILGKAAKVPVYQLLGGPTRNKMRAYTSIHGEDDDAMLKSLERARAAGHLAFSAGVPQPPFRNSGKALVLAAQKRMEALNKAAGDTCNFILSGGGRLTPGDAQILSAGFEHFHLLWFDEPCNSTSLSSLRKLAQENVTPLGFGQGATEASFFQNLLREDAVDIVRPEIAIHGMSGVRKIAALAEVYYVAVAPRHNEGPLTTVAAGHLAASLPNFFIQHIPYPDAPADREMRSALTGGNAESIKDGYAALSTKPGLGVEVRMDAVRKYGSVIA